MSATTLPAPSFVRRAPVAAAPARRPAGITALFAMFLGYPLWWCLGLGAMSWFVFAVPMAWVLFRSERIRVPRGFGVWLLFLAWVLLSATKLDGAGEVIGFTWRLVTYLSATVVFLFVYNQSPKALPGRRVATALGFLWVAVALGGWLGIVSPAGSLPSLTEHLLPGSIAADPFVHELVRPSFAQVQNFLGYDLGRPKAPFAYTNDWGSNFGLLFPVFVLGWVGSRNRRRRRLAPLFLLASLVPALYSLNRGMWLSLGVGLVYVAIGFAARGRAGGMRLLGTVVVVLGAALLLVAPLRSVVEDRLDTPHSNKGRELLYSQALDLVAAAPIIGHGAPQDVGNNKLLPDVGTQGQLWLVLVSQGLVGAIFFVTAIAGAAWRTRRGPTVPFWCHVTLVVALVQLPFYDMLPVSLHVIALCAAIALRRVDEPEPAPERAAAVGRLRMSEHLCERVRRMPRLAAVLDLRDDETVLDGLRVLLGGGDAVRAAVLPSPARPRHLVPLRPGPAAAAALAGRAGDRRLAGRLATRALAAAAGAGAGRLVPASRVVTGADGPSLPAWLDEVLGTRGCVVAIGVGPPRANRKPVLQVLAADGTTLAWGKVGWDPLTRRLVGDEADVLQQLGGALAPDIAVPAVVARARWQGSEVVLTAPLPLRGRARRPLRPDPELLRTVAGPPAPLDAWHRATARRLAAVGHDELVPVLDRVADRLTNAGVPGARWHGDLTPWNVGRVPGGRAVWDWERSAAPVPLGLDAVHASYAVATLRDGVAVAEALGAAADDATGALGALGMTTIAVPAVAAAYAIELLLRQEEDRAHWTSPALERTCTALAGALTDGRLGS